MMSEPRVRLLVGSAARDRLRAAAEWLRARPGEALVVAPTRGAADDLTRAAAAEDGGLLGITRATLAQLAHELASPELAQRGWRPVAGVSVRALVARCVDRALDERDLQRLAEVAPLPGFPAALQSTLLELRLQGLTCESLQRGPDSCAELAILLAAYERELEAAGLADWAAVLDLAKSAVSGSGFRYRGWDLALVDVEPRRGLEADLISELVQAMGEVLVTTPRYRQSTGAVWRQLLGVAPAEVASSEAESTLTRARARLFVLGDAAEGEDEDDRVEFFAAPGEDRECVEIARRIHRLADAGTTFDRMAILLRQVTSYQPLVEDALRRARIPAYFTRGTRRPDPAGRAFLALLGCAVEKLSASRFAEFLSFGEIATLDSVADETRRTVPWVPAQGDQLVLKTVETVADPAPEVAEAIRVPAYWESLLVDASVIGGEERWRRRLDGLREELLLQLGDMESEEEGRRQAIERRLQRLQTLRAFALPVIARLAALPAAAVWGAWLDALEELAVAVLRNPHSVQRLLAELRPMAEVGPVPLVRVREVLAERLSFLQREPPARRFGRVFVGTIDEAAGRVFDVVFLPGLAEGIFPRRSFEDPLLLDEARAAVDPDLDNQESRLRRERGLLHAALDAAGTKLVASYPSLDLVQGRARVPSFYALDLLRAARGALPPLREIEQVAASAGADRQGLDPGQAIDEAEFDLAVLGRTSPRPEPGAGRYLLEANPHVARSLRHRARRWRNFWSYADGLVLEPGSAAHSALEAHLPDRRSYSPTALQNYSRCPYRFFLYTIQGLRVRDEIVALERLDPLTRGALFHEVQFRFFSASREREILRRHADFETAQSELLDESLDAVARDWEERLSPALPRVWKSEIESLRADLRGWLRKTILDDGDWTPTKFEYAFGLPVGPERDPDSTTEAAVVLGGIKLRGSIDLVERDWKRRELRVTDHKTGRAEASRDMIIQGGEILQPLIYALAAEQLLLPEGEKVRSGRLFYCTERGGYETVEVTLDEFGRARIAQVFETVEGALHDGFLPAAPREGACRYCDYRLVCGPYEERRLDKKMKNRESKERLRPLLELRAQP